MESKKVVDPPNYTPRFDDDDEDDTLFHFDFVAGVDLIHQGFLLLVLFFSLGLNLKCQSNRNLH